MFLDVNELAARKTRIRKSYAPGTLDFHSGEFRQVEPLEVRATAELVEGQIRICGNLHTRIELVCARCLDTVIEEISRDFDLFYRPMTSMSPEEELQLNLDDTEMAFFEGDGLFPRRRARRTGESGAPHEGDLLERLPRALPPLRRQPEQRRMPLRKERFRPPARPTRPAEAGLVQKAIKRYTVCFHSGRT